MNRFLERPGNRHSIPGLGFRIGFLHLYCVATGPNVALIDGVEAPFQNVRSLSFSPNRAHAAFVASPARGEYMIVIDGKPGPALRGTITGPVYLSPDGKECGYDVANGRRRQFIFDGKPAPEAQSPEPSLDPNPGIHSAIYRTFFFSKDSKHFAYIAREARRQDAGKQAVVRDGVEGALYDGIVTSSLIFSPDFRHFAYVASNGGKYVMVVDGVERAGGAPAPNRMSNRLSHPLALSPDGKHVAYVHEDGGNSRVMLDAAPGPVFTQILAGPVFTPQGKLQYIARKQADYFRIIQSP